jgi:CO dehydrogenase/acetyl-CoA synthase beta subunit
MAAAIRAQVYDKVGGRIDFSQVQDPSQFSDEQSDEEPVKSTKTKKKVVVQEEEVEEQPAPRQPAPAPAPVRRLEKPTFTF